MRLRIRAFELLLVLAWVPILVSSQQVSTREPPAITYLASNIDRAKEGHILVNKELKHPSDYLLIGHVSGDYRTLRNMTCRAKNADKLKFQHKAEADGSFNDTLPRIMSEEKLRTLGNGELELTIGNGSHNSIEQLATLNGYYRCVASRIKGKYVTISATFKVVMPSPAFCSCTRNFSSCTQKHDIKWTLKGASNLTNFNPTANQPYRLPCQDAASNPQPILPDCEGCSLRNLVNYVWKKHEGVDGRTEMILDLNSEKYRDRVSIEPETGDLLFDYLLEEDSLNNSGSNYEYYRCYKLVDLVGLTETSNYNRLQVAQAVNNPTVVSFASPRPEEVETIQGVNTVKKTVHCVNSTICSITCIFGGILAQSDKIRALKVEEPSETANTTATSFYFMAKAKEEEEVQMWECQLYDQQEDVALETLRFRVLIRTYPRPSPGSNFPANVKVSEGSDVSFTCDAKVGSNSQTKFFINGKEVTADYPSHVDYNPNADDTLLRIRTVSRNHVASILCVTTNEAGSLYLASNLAVEFDGIDGEADKPLTALEQQVIERVLELFGGRLRGEITEELQQEIVDAITEEFGSQLSNDNIVKLIEEAGEAQSRLVSNSNIIKISVQTFVLSAAIAVVI